VTQYPKAVRGWSRESARLFHDLMLMAPPQRRGLLAELGPGDLEQVLAVAALEGGTPYALWRDDPVGFVTDVLRESTWSKPRQILATIPGVNRVAVPSCYASGKTWSAARSALWFSMVHPPGTAKVVTLAPTWRQVVRLLWAEVRVAHSRAGLPGTVDMAQLKIPDASGAEVVVAYGLSAAPWNEAAVQGIHAPKLLLIVDEAGGLSHTIGRNLRGMTSTEGSHMLAIGNPPTDEENSWFETLCAQDDVTVIPISAYETPGLSGETAPRCLTCHPEDVHPVSRHLVKPSWVAETIREHGDDSHYVQAKVYARFPTGGPSRAIPSAWIDAAHDVEEPPRGPKTVALNRLGVPGETGPWMVPRKAWVRLGVDVAADGGDELVVARVVGDLATIRQVSAGSANTNSVDVAGVILTEIRRAEALAKVLGDVAPVRVKIDSIGIGWGVAGTLKKWGKEGKHGAQIEAVVVSEIPNREPDSATLHPSRKRDEMWLAMRALLEPSRDFPAGQVRLRVDSRALAQLRSPTMSTTSDGKTEIESKKSLRKRGLSSPDRAEALLLAVYEPGPARRRRHKAKLIA
jgi:hypothetical protein